MKSSSSKTVLHQSFTHFKIQFLSLELEAEAIEPLRGLFKVHDLRPRRMFEASAELRYEEIYERIMWYIYIYI